MQQQQENQALWASYWGERQRSLQNPLGKRRAVIAAFQLLRRLARKFAQPVRIIELGCGEGHVLAELLKLCTANKIAVESAVGVDNQAQIIESARRVYPQIDFVVADYAREPLDLRPFDLVLLVGTLHEVFSSNYSRTLGEIDRRLGKQAVKQALERSARMVGDNRSIVLFDGVESALPDFKITVKFQSSDSLEEFRNLVSNYEAFRLDYEELEEVDRIRISLHDFTRYITKTRFFNSSLWEIEKRESYQYFNEEEFRKALGAVGFDILELQCSSPYQEDWRNRVSIETSGADFPQENILIVAQRKTQRALEG